MAGNGRMFLVIALVVALGHPQFAFGQEDAQARFNQAVELARAGNHQDAVGICLEVLKLLPESDHARVHKLLGFSYKGLEKLPEAWHHLSQYVEATGKEDKATDRWLEKVETKLKQDYVKVVVACNPDGATLSVESHLSEGQQDHVCPLTWWFKPGKHKVVASKSGYETRTQEIEVRERGDKGVHIITLAGGEIALPGGGKSQAVAGWALLGGGLAVGVAGIIVQGLAYAENEELHDNSATQGQYEADKEEQVKPKEIAAGVLMGVGGAAVLAGIVTLVVKKKKKGKEAAAISFAPYSLPHGGGAMISFEW